MVQDFESLMPGGENVECCWFSFVSYFIVIKFGKVRIMIHLLNHLP